MKKINVVSTILGHRLSAPPHHSMGKAFAPSNIALCKYWGKRDGELNLPVTPSLSISLGQKGSICTIKQSENRQDYFSLNNQVMDINSPFGKRLGAYLDLFRTPKNIRFHIDMQMNIPYAAGLASSACGFASLVLALDKFFGWELSDRELSILARLGSGSACRSIFPGFVEWHTGSQVNGMDSYAEPFAKAWPEFRIGLLIVNDQEKAIASRDAMEKTVATSALYSAWPSKVDADLKLLKQAVTQQDFQLLGETAESNALTMHALMLSAWPPISYAMPETVLVMQQVWQLRREGRAIYFTQDAGPNLKLLFLESESKIVRENFPEVESISPLHFSLS